MDAAALPAASPADSGDIAAPLTPDPLAPDPLAADPFTLAPPPPFAVEALARYQRLERLVNIVVAAVALIVAAPLMLVIALAIKLTSKGPVLYRQPRIGLDRRGVRLHSRRRTDSRWHLWARFLALHDDLRAQDLGGEVFMIYKFRTMCDAAECNTGAVWAVKDDPRSTRIGCFLRKYRLDELPQLFNVLRGNMNIVGPRPERPSIFARLAAEIEDYPLRQRTKPGITGWAQIHLKYDSCVDDVRKKVRYDLEYLRQKSLTRDLKIIVKTLPSVLFKRRGW
ncbi:MAG TPA: sugar transferase [Gemmatimonadaceae bacterium]|jgi:lipopolysaccharide/colanic/teichoic acid biosynthesis glycosyltransferase